MPNNLTFVDAYNLQLKVRDSKSKSFSHIYQRISEEEISDEMSRVAILLTEERTSAVLKQMKSRLKQIPPPFSSLIGTWLDNDGLDILHHSIAYNCPEIIDFLLVESKLFPPSQMPFKNPYAHLAAAMGNTECLRLILHHRPTDYFSGSKLQHVLKLPPNIKKKLKSPEVLRSGVNKQVEKLLLRLKSSTDTAEIEMERIRSNNSENIDVGGTLSSEIEALEKSHKKKGNTQKIKKLGFVSTFASRSMKRGQAAAVTSTPPQTLVPAVKFTAQDNQEKKTAATPKFDKHEDTLVPKYHKPHPVRQVKKHAITVFWDVFSESPMGVVKGAGEHVKLTYTNDARRERLDPGILERRNQPTETGRLMASLPPVTKQSDSLKVKQKSGNPKHRSYRNSISGVLPKILEPGIRGRKKYKEFHLSFESQSSDPKDDSDSLRNKTPLSLAAQYGYLDCVQMILETFILKNNPTMAVKEPLTLATKAKSPDAIMLLMNHKTTRADYQSAVLIAIREMYPDCLTALLAQKGKDKQTLFDGVNLYHVLYTQSLVSQCRYEMLPTMTNALINSNEDANAHNIYCTFPMYTLINCAFNITLGNKIFWYVECLKILLDNKANPHFDEGKSTKQASTGMAFSRSAYSSAINCILENAVNSVNFFESTYWSKLFMKKFMLMVTANDRTHRRLLNDVLFNYLRASSTLDVDRYIIRCLLRYGANADYRTEGKYAINVYFDTILPYLTKFEVNSSYNKWQNELKALMMVCRGMSYKCLKEAELIFLNDHLLQCPIQALPLCRYFSYLINEILMSPRPLAELAAQHIWLTLKRNEKRAKMLPLPDDLIAFILP